MENRKNTKDKFHFILKNPNLKKKIYVKKGGVIFKIILKNIKNLFLLLYTKKTSSANINVEYYYYISCHEIYFLKDNELQAI